MNHRDKHNRALKMTELALGPSGREREKERKRHRKRARAHVEACAGDGGEIESALLDPSPFTGPPSANSTQ